MYIANTLDQLVVQHKVNAKSGKISFSTVDKRKCPLQGNIVIQHLAQQDVRLVYFRKSKGDPIEFKRFYKAVLASSKEQLANEGF